MRSSIKLIPVLLLTSILGAAQSSTTGKPADKPASGAAVNLPSEATVDSFMQQTFGYEPQVSWKISSIKPAPVPGLAQVDVVLASPQGQQISRFYVTADGEHAVIGDIIPFGARAVRSGEEDAGEGNHRPLARTERCGGHDCGVWRSAVPGLQGGSTCDRGAHCG